VRVGLVLGSGGTVGRVFHLAVLRALEQERGWRADDAHVIVGTSAGSIVAAVAAAGVTPAAQLAEVAGHRRGRLPTVAGRLPATPRPRLGRGRPTATPAQLLARLAAGARPSPAVLAALLPRGTTDLAAHAAWIDRLTDGRWPSQVRICAVALPGLERVVWDGDGGPTLGTAVAASCALPGFLAPVRVDGREHVDGGVHAPTNADVLLGEGCDVAVVSSPMSTSGRHGLARPDRPLRWLWHRALRREVAALRAAGIGTIVIEPDPTEFMVLPSNLLDGRGLPRIATILERSLRVRLRRGELDPHRHLVR
jgi:NTE family protein